MLADHRDQHVAGPHVFLDFFFKADPWGHIDIHEDPNLGKVRGKAVIQASRRRGGVIAPVTDEDLAPHGREPPAATA
jgi:hypothetical protein